ncbi:hypothetical protein GS597_07240 [Synechococcales cyanobacterium C]|uniref:Uncharacterized protein n=1 Tax=Petrachloros mirabilis ULC683 TaxID=2781853 RepID=A0A8K1ZYJ9_9CYAN|nr:hypothetical protein [Petrachloros mirabilis]NCJ06308.1 hypothetical protein [Petrachloros mirabilis ULC683]
MSQSNPPQSIRQVAKNVGQSSTQIAGNSEKSYSINISLLVSVFFISIAAASVAWALAVGSNPNPVVPPLPATPQEDIGHD